VPAAAFLGAHSGSVAVDADSAVGLDNGAAVAAVEVYIVAVVAAAEAV